MYKFTLEKALTYDDFMAYANRIIAGEINEAPYDKESYLQYTDINTNRSEKILRNFQLDKKLYNVLNEGIEKWTWVLITEPWCGDGSFLQPILYAMSLASAGSINFKIVLRDKNPEIMNNYLTNGGMAIPKLVCLDKDLNELGTWGPRPTLLQEQFNEWTKDPEFDTHTKIKKVNRWYIKDKNQSIQSEFINLIKNWKNK